MLQNIFPAGQRDVDDTFLTQQQHHQHGISFVIKTHLTSLLFLLTMLYPVTVLSTVLSLAEYEGRIIKLHLIDSCVLRHLSPVWGMLYLE